MIIRFVQPQDREAVARRLYDLMEADDVRRVVMGDIGPDGFVTLTHHDVAWLFAGEDAEGNWLGWAVITGFYARSAQGHFCMLRRGFLQGTAFVRGVLADAFRTGKLDSVYGLTPQPYRHALRAIAPLAVRGGVIPGGAVDHLRGETAPGVLSVFTPDSILEE